MNMGKSIENLRVAVVDAIPRGGILQFSAQLHKSLLSLGCASRLWVPDGSVLDDETEATQYARHQSFNWKNRDIRQLEESVRSFDPDLVMLTNKGLVTSQLQLNIGDIPTFQFVHDPTPHPSTGHYLRDLKAMLCVPYQSAALKRCDRVVLLSRSSKEKFDQLHPEFAGKSDVLRLGAHVPDAEPAVPPELAGAGNAAPFFLFFGRIDTYKGIDRLIEAYCASSCAHRLVIAGKGVIPRHGLEMARQDDRVVLLNRFIGDGEMVWLFQRALATVLPYIEASQSGVLPISYYFSVPVIVSRLHEFEEYVVEGETGLFFDDQDSLIRILTSFDDSGVSRAMRDGAKEFERANLSWDAGLTRLLHAYLED